MKKMPIVFILLILILPLTIAELSNEDAKKIEAIVRREIEQGNQKLKDDLYSDIDAMRGEISHMVDQITMSTTGTKLVLILSLAGVIIVAETGISLMKYLVSRKRRDKPEKLRKEIDEAQKILKKHNKEIDDAMKSKTKLGKEILSLDKKIMAVKKVKKSKNGNS